jgi:hypothetical protein
LIGASRPSGCAALEHVGAAPEFPRIFDATVNCGFVLYGLFVRRPHRCAESNQEGNDMAATATELKRIYGNLFREPGNPRPLHALRRALAPVKRDDFTSRGEADRLLTSLNEGVDPELTFTQLESLGLVLSQKDFAPLIPTVEQSADTARPLIELYKRLFAEPDLAHLRALQQAVFEYSRISARRGSGATRTSGRSTRSWFATSPSSRWRRFR